MVEQRRESTPISSILNFGGSCPKTTLDLLQGAGVWAALAVTTVVCALGLGMAFSLPRDRA